MKKAKISIIIPAYNEEAVIESFLGRLKRTLAGIGDGHEIIVVDDGSADDTYAAAKNIPEVKVIRHPYNKGNGAAVKTGILNAEGDKLAVIDADGQHDPAHIPEMLGMLDEYDLVVGARKSFGLGGRGVGNIIVSKLACYLSGIDIPDLTCGFRVFKKENMLEFIDLLPNGYSLPSTSTLAFATSGYNVKFIPITADVRQGGESNISILKDGMKFLVLIFRMISLFKPLKIFTPVSLSLFAIGLFWSIRGYYLTSIISPLGTMILLSGLFTFLFGLMVDQLSQARLTIGKLVKYQIKKNEENK